jgi:proteic killer suppression protein
MLIEYKQPWLEKIGNSDSMAKRKLGPSRAEKLRRRLDELDAADTLEVMRNLKQARCHELGADRKGGLSVDLDHPYRLIFVPANDPVPRKPDGGLDWSGVTAIRIVDIVDYH